MKRVVLAALLGACGGGGSGGADAGPTPDGGSPGFADEAPGYVHVLERSDNMGSAYSAGIQAAFRTETLAFYDEVARSGDCRLLHGGDFGYCTVPCDGLCTGDGTCVPFPAQSSAGTLTVTGLAVPAVITPTDAYYYWSADQPVLQAGTDVTASAPGADFGGFSLSAPAPAPLEVTNLDQLEPAGDRDLIIEWTPAGDPEARVFLSLITDRGHAQIHPVVIECDLPDTGTLAVPRSMMAEYADPANWSCGDCFSSHIERYTRATTTVGDVTVELRASSMVDIYLPVY